MVNLIHDYTMQIRRAKRTYIPLSKVSNTYVYVLVPKTCLITQADRSNAYKMYIAENNVTY